MASASGADRDYPTRDIGGITVIDTPIVKAAQDYAREHSTDAAFAHIMRSWLYGVIAISADPSLNGKVDMEVHALGALLHDLGWDQTPGSPHVSQDKRFEVDGAIAARKFIRNHVDGKDWDEIRVQRVWDAIALHCMPDIFSYKEIDVQAIPRGISMDFFGPAMAVVSEEEYSKVGKAFPKTEFHACVKDTLTWICRTKPDSTVDTWIQPFGEEYVSDYSATGKRAFDHIFAKLYP